MGFEEWENKYRRKPHLNDFLDNEEEDSVILRMGNLHKSIHQRSPHTMYPEGYDTIDRRKRKKLRDPGGFCHGERNAFTDERRGEKFMRQLAEMQEEEERLSTCLTPFREGLLYKTRMWAKNDLDNTLENYVTYKRQEDARRRAQFKLDNYTDFHLDSDEDVEYFDDLYPENTRQYKDRFAYDSALDIPQGYRERKCRKSKLGEWAPEAMLSPVEEPLEEFVDPMDELQCLVETVSEYLAEKEEEISRYGSLPKSNKSRLSSLGSYHTDSFGDDTHNLKDSKRDSTSQKSEQGITGVKNAVSSLFSSLSEKVNKQPVASSQPQAAEPQSSGLTKLFSFIPKSKNTAPVAVVSPVESEKNFAYLCPQPQEPKLQGNVRNSTSTQRTNNPSLETATKTQNVPGNTVLDKLNPLKLFSTDNSQSSENRQPPEQNFQSDLNKMYREKQPVPTNRPFVSDENMYIKQNMSSATQQEKTGLFSSFPKSLSSLITPSAPIPPQGPPSIAVYPIHDSTPNPPQQKADDSSFKLKLPFLSSENVSAQQQSKAEGGMLSGFLKFASNEDVSASKNVQNQPNKSSPQVSVSQPSSTQQQTTEKGWFSSLFAAPDASQPTQNVQNRLPDQHRTPQGSQSHQSHPRLGPSEKQNQPESQGFLTGLLKTNSNDNKSAIPNQPNQGLLSGFLKFGSTSDLSAPTQSHQPPPSHTQPKLSHHQTPQQQNPPQGTTGGFLTGLFKLSSAENVSPNAEVVNQSKVTSAPPTQQTSEQSQGFLSSFLKLTSTENDSKKQTVQEKSPPAHLGQPIHSQNPVSPNQSVATSHPRQQFGPQEIRQPSVSRQQTVPPQQTQSQRSGLLTGLFKFASADSIDTRESLPDVSQSKSNYDQRAAIDANKDRREPVLPQNKREGIGFLSSSHKTSSETVERQAQSNIFHKPEHQTAKAESANQPGVFSGLFNKITKSENVETTSQISTANQRETHHMIQQSFSTSQESCKGTSQPNPQGFLSGLFHKKETEQIGNQRKTEVAGPVTEQRTQSASFPSDGMRNIGSDARGNANQPAALPGRSRHAFVRAPVSIDAESLDLRTSATFARSLQSQTTYASVSMEQGMWWPAEDGDCGYFVYTDHEYIYALLTDAAGVTVKHVDDISEEEWRQRVVPGKEKQYPQSSVSQPKLHPVQVEKR
ncbi:hypothetical protein WMY93_021731 [Mugilogobius chulae]|uniref:Uncharacterized protein n=1 Tax=Mugilogobius chulae TaxID=88201 RepID=A0AAW0NFU1_9GOBI